MIMNAAVIQVRPENLLVRDLSNNQEVMVHFRNSNRFSAGDHVRITYDGKMTLSIPPQITASSIQLNRPSNPPRPPRPPQPPQPPIPAETRAAVTQIGRDFLLVRGLQDNRLMRVNYVHAHHFCVGQRVIVKHDTIIMNNPPEVNAIDITPLC